MVLALNGTRTDLGFTYIMHENANTYQDSLSQALFYISYIAGGTFLPAIILGMVPVGSLIAAYLAQYGMYALLNAPIWGLEWFMSNVTRFLVLLVFLIVHVLVKYTPDQYVNSFGLYKL